MANVLTSDLVEEVAWYENMLPGPCADLDDGIVVIMATITPATAALLLETRNPRNRRVRQKQVDRLTKEIRADTFRFTGDTIVFDCHGMLRNGQHRLMACKIADKPIRTLVVVGVDESAYMAMDQHARRGFYDVLDQQNERDSRVLSATLGQLFRFFSTGMFSDKTDVMYTNDELSDLLAKMPEVRDSVRLALSLRCAATGRSSLMAALHFVFGRVNKDLSSHFWTSFANSSIPQEKCWDQLRDVKRKIEASNDASRSLPQIQRAAYFIYAWNSVLTGNTKERVLWKPGGRTPFPKVRGWNYINGKPISPRPLTIDFGQPSEEDED